MSTVAIDEFKDRRRTVWASGDYPTVAARIHAAADDLVAAAELADGATVLDIATGSGNVAVPAAGKGAAVTGLDLVPELLEAAARHADAEGVDVGAYRSPAEYLPVLARVR